MAAQSRVLIVTNKYWECDPVCWALTNAYVRDTTGGTIVLPMPKLVRYPTYGPTPLPPAPRLVYGAPSVQVELWCISDLLTAFPPTPDYQSSSQRKMDVLGTMFDCSPLPVIMVVAVGTASSGPYYPVKDNINGSVIIGSNIFMHDGHPASSPNPASQWRCSYYDQLMRSCVAFPSCGVLNSLEPLLLCPPTNPGPAGQHMYLQRDYVAIGDINVTDYKEYKAKDLEAGQSFLQHCPGNTNGVSLETTHGLIYAKAREYFQTDPPFMFVSGVVDRFTMFDIDVKRTYPQNVTGAHNAGIAVTGLVYMILNNLWAL